MEALSETLGEHKIGTELDRLEASETRRMLKAVKAAQNRKQSVAIRAALAVSAGDRYTPGELAAACTGAIRAACSRWSTRTPADDQSDLRNALILKALEHAARCNLDRGESPGHGKPGEQAMPRREDLQGKDHRDGQAWLYVTARNLLTDHYRSTADVDTGGSEAEREAILQRMADKPAHDTPRDAVSMEELGEALEVSKREAWALAVAGGTESAVLAVEEGKPKPAMCTAITKGRNSLRARLTVADVRAAGEHIRRYPAGRTHAAHAAVPMLRTRPLYPTERNRPTRRDHGRGAAARDVLRYIAAVEAAIVEVPAAALEAADLALRWTADTRRNQPAPRTTGGYLTATRPTALIARDGHHHIVPAIGPVHVRTLQADLPTIERRAINGRRLWQALGTPSRAPMPYSAPRTANHVTTHADHVDAWTRPTPRTPNHHHAPAHREATTRAGKLYATTPTHTLAHGGALHAIAATLTANRTAAIAANRATREAARDGLKVTRLEATGRV